MNLYKILGIDKGADDSEIRKAYKRAAQKSHPDKGGDPETFHQIQVAYDVLTDPDRRAQYDQTGSTERRQSPKDAARTELASLFAGLVAKEDFHGDIIEKCRQMVERRRSEVRQAAETATAKAERLQKRFDRIKANSDNLFEQILRDEAKKHLNQVDAHKRSESVLSEVLALLDEYEDSDPEKSPHDDYLNAFATQPLGSIFGQRSPFGL